MTADISKPKPVILVTDDDSEGLATIRRALDHRFGADYQVLAAETADQGLAFLERLSREGAEVALVAGSRAVNGVQGTDFLDRARELHPGAIRALILNVDASENREPGDIAEPFECAAALGRVDMSILKGWVSPEEWLYPDVQDALSKWSRANRPRHEVVRVLGGQWAPRSHELRDLLTRNAVQNGFVEANSEVGQQLLTEHDLKDAELPVAVFSDGRVLVDPSNVEMAEALGGRTKPDSKPYDVVIVGAGPAGLAAAVYATSEGLRTVVIEPEALGGQAGTSSMIRNYLGFPRGLSGKELTARAYQQARLLGAEIVFMLRATGLEVRGERRAVQLSDGSKAIGSAVVIATGVTYRRLGIPSLDDLLGAGVFYGAAATEARAMSGLQVYVIGAGNSAGQGAVHLARYAESVTMVCRGESIAESMSDYLVHEVEGTPNINTLFHTQVTAGRGVSRLRGLELEDMRTGERREVAASAVFVMIGAVPHTEWLAETLARDRQGYICTGGDIDSAAWPLERDPHFLETSLPGIFAVGDVRAGSVKRVASAVGDGSVAIRFVHEYLAGLREAPVVTGR
jgi:thioredoxin reductase (NADPH)